MAPSFAFIHLYIFIYKEAYIDLKRSIQEFIENETQIYKKANVGL